MGVTADDILEMLVAQDGKCALTGVPLKYWATVSRKFFREPTLISVDRIDSSANYTRDNIQLVCAIVNQMKNDMSSAEFGYWCKRVVLHALSQETADGVAVETRSP